MRKTLTMDQKRVKWPEDPELTTRMGKENLFS